MKFNLTFKTPDVLDAIEREFPLPSRSDFNSDDEYEIEKAKVEDQREEAVEFAKKFVEYGETIVVEFDTEVGTATVL